MNEYSELFRVQTTNGHSLLIFALIKNATNPNEMITNPNRTSAIPVDIRTNNHIAIATRTGRG